MKQLSYETVYGQFKTVIDNNPSILEGKGYYERTHGWLKNLTKHCRYDDVTLAGILAVCTPRMDYNRVLLSIEQFVYTGIIPKYLNLHKDKVERIIGGDFSAISGKKVLSFFRAVLGDKSAVAVDVHILSYVGLKCSYVSDHNYRTVREAIQKLASEYGLSARDLQANLWHFARKRA